MGSDSTPPMTYAEPMTLHTYPLRVQLHDTDAAGVLFFAHQLRYAHDAYEAMMAERGLPIAELLRSGSAHLPIVHCEADYLVPLRHGDRVDVDVRLQRLGTTSFSLHYRFISGGRRAATATTVHVAIDPETKNKIPLPENIKLIFSNK